MHKYQKINIFLVIVVTLFLIGTALAWYYAYFDDKNLKQNSIDSLYSKISDETIINELYDTIIDNNLLLLSNNEINIDNVDNIDMNTKINLAYYTIKQKDQNIYENGIEVSNMEEYFKNIFKDIIYWDKNDIYCTCSDKIFIFDIENNKYVYNTNHLPHSSYIFPYYTKILNVYNHDNKYIVNLTNVWDNINNDIGYIQTGYKSYSDALNNKNPLFGLNFTFEEETLDKDYYAIKEINDNFSKYEKDLNTYSYTFEKIDNKYYLTKFEIKN